MPADLIPIAAKLGRHPDRSIDDKFERVVAERDDLAGALVEAERERDRAEDELETAVASLRDVLAELKDRTAEARGARSDYEELKGVNADTARERDEALAELDRVRADLAAAHNHAHRQDTEIQQIVRAKGELATERDALKPVVEAAKVWRQWYGNTNPSYASACNDLAAAMDALIESGVAR